MVKKNVIQLAYAAVNNIPAKDIENKEHQVIINKALTEVWSYPNAYPGETDALIDKRLDMPGPASGEVSSLAQHFKDLYPDEFKKGTTPWNIIFIIYNKLQGLQGSVEAVATQTTDVVGDDNTISNKEKEDITMSNTVTQEGVSTLEEIEKANSKLSSAGDSAIKTEQTSTSMPNAESSKATSAAVKKFVEDSIEDRKNFFRNTKVTVVVISKPEQVLVCVDGKDAIGAPSNAEAALASFIKKTGCVIEGGTGAVTFTSVAPENVDEAKEMYDTLKSLVEDPTREIPAYFPVKAGVVIKGFRYVDARGKNSKYMKYNEMLKVMLNQSIGALTLTDGEQIKVKKPKVTSVTSGKRKGGGKDKKLSAPNEFAGISSIGFTNRTSTAEKCGKYWKEIIKEDVELRCGMKSAAKAVYLVEREEQDDTGNKKKVLKPVIYRVPLLVKQYKLAVVDEELKDLGDGESTVGGSVAPLNLDDDKAVKEMMECITNVSLDAITVGISSDAYTAIKKKAAEMDVAETEKEAADIDGVNL